MTADDASTTPLRAQVFLGVGIDLTSVEAVRQALADFGDRYLARIFTEHEIETALAATDPAPHLAARFAAKEATIKALRVDGAQPAWTTMEVRRDPVGWCVMRLTGEAAALAARMGVANLSVSLTHEGDVAAAVVVATADLPS